ncbi:MAG: hypothetical protein SGJ23_06910 [Alphaproteobacteria bacterium]|nr:hypothetical protein [Alphaproteobacteria bacterium]
MRRFILAGLMLAASAATAHAQKPPACPDLAITYAKQVRSIRYNAPLAADEIAFRFTVKNVGSAALVSPSHSAQWISLEVMRGTASLGIHVLPPSTPVPGPVRIEPGATMDGFLRARFPAALPPTAPLWLQLNYLTGAGGPTAPVDCSTANNTRRVSYRRP